MILENARIVVGDGACIDGWVRIENGTIAEVGEGRTPAGEPAVDVGGRWLGPGFIDPHIHGGYGTDVMDADPAGVRELARALTRHGVTAFLPSTYTASHEATLAALRAIEAARSSASDGAGILGVHMEGPFLSARCRGAHPEAHLEDGSAERLHAYLDAALVRVMTVAPERAGNEEVIAHLRAAGVVVSLGHSDALVAQVRAAVDAGAQSVTHLFNGMRAFHHREAGILGAALAFPELTCELIADGIHVSSEALRLAWLAKGPRGIMLVSDAGRTAGPERHGGDAIRLADGTLSSSSLMIDAGLRRLCDATGATLAEAWAASGPNAATVLGLRTKGSVCAGFDADLTVLDSEGMVTATVVGGTLVHGGL